MWRRAHATLPTRCDLHSCCNFANASLSMRFVVSPLRRTRDSSRHLGIAAAAPHIVGESTFLGLHRFGVGSETTLRSPSDGRPTFRRLMSISHDLPRRNFALSLSLLREQQRALLSSDTGDGSVPASSGPDNGAPPSGENGDDSDDAQRAPPVDVGDESEVKKMESDAVETLEREESAKKDVEAEGKEGSPAADGAAASSLSETLGSTTNAIVDRMAVPKEYPQLLALPLTRRPLFPGFYKSLYIKDKNVITAIQSLLERRQPYIGIFLTRDDSSELDVITDVNQVHPVGIFAQITNIYQAGMDNSSLTVVLYPHRRIELKDLIPPPESQKKVATVTEKKQSDFPTIEPTGTTAPKSKGRRIRNAAASDKDDAQKSGEEVDDSAYLPINKHLANREVSVVNVENLYDQPYVHDTPVIKAISSEMLNVLKEISQINPLLRDQIITFSIQTGGNAFGDPAKLADFAAAVSAGEPGELQGVLEALSIEDRLHKALVVLKKELANAKLQQEIAKEVDKKITRKQQEYFLMEQLKGIKKELGIDTDGKDKLVEKFLERAANLTMPEAVRKVFEEELKKLQDLESAAAEFNVTRNYLDWLTQIPWGKHSEENFDIRHARTVLDQDHYGLKDVKDRILEFIAVGKLRGTVEGKIICLSGPPGVGKTSVGKSIAHALGREFFRFSVGGLTDVAEIKGHRRTYVGAMPGKVVQALKKVQTENPLIMIDEIDKLGRGHQGDPASALLELLDPEQNNSFLDHYMDVPIDLSKVLFVCTANMLETIPAPLLDRMEIISLSGYVSEEKVAIATKYLSPQARSAAGLTESQVEVTKDAIEGLIRYYCRESGVRNLKKHIEKIFRKAALKIVQLDADKEDAKEKENAVVGEQGKVSKEKDAEVAPATSTVDGSESPVKPQIVVDQSNLKDFVGSPVYTSDRMYDTTPAGVVMGLAWTSMGGSALYIESVLESSVTENSRPSLNRTGQMGDVMKESTTIAYTYARSLMTKRFPDNKFFEKASVHLHVPEGATPKDGPSAGCTMATSLLSLALNSPILPDVAMTGELTLTGKILKIGGVKEKTIAAKRSGVKRIIFPSANKADWDELPEYIREGIDPLFVGYYEELFEAVFPEEVVKGKPFKNNE
ncbi:Lon protease C-terminal proteolytic domain-containing protein [Cladochytrium replicatum]|nr:Lon protease C-terminal proteolytic domain-containing protein [Cladochytrium replicatum]